MTNGWADTAAEVTDAHRAMAKAELKRLRRSWNARDRWMKAVDRYMAGDTAPLENMRRPSREGDKRMYAMAGRITRLLVLDVQRAGNMADLKVVIDAAAVALRSAR